MLMRSAFIPAMGFAVALVTGCAREQKETRPTAGDVVSVLIHRPKSWHEGKPATLNVRLRIEGPSVAKADFLRDQEVPHDEPPIITITFLKEGDTLKVYDKLAMTPDC